MVDLQLLRRGIADEVVLSAMGRVQRHRFVDPSHADQAYEDHPLPIGWGQTISQPYMVARMTELCAPAATDLALEVGSGSGYQTAVLAELCQHVYAVEIVEELAAKGERTLRELGYTNVTMAHRDGSSGWPEHSPFNIILVAAGSPVVPDTLRQQLCDGGRLVIPVGGRDFQILKRITRRGDAFDMLDDTPCRFVNLRGEHGWDG